MSSADVSPLDSVVFRTQRLAEVRAWYESVLGLRAATLDDGREDADARYVNFRSGNVLVGFETGSDVDRARLVFFTGDLAALKRGLKAPVATEGKGWLIVKDPEGREVILQQKP